MANDIDERNRSSVATGVSVAARGAVGFLTNGNVLSSTAGLPNDTPTLGGADVALHFGRLQDGRVRQVGSLSVSYVQGTSSEHITAKDLPIPDSFASLVDIDIRRSATFHMASGQWSWDMDKPVYESRVLRIISPSFRLGAGGAYVTQRVQSNGKTTQTDHAFLFGTGAVGGTVAAIRLGRYEVSIDGAVGICAGSLIAMTGEAAFKITYHWLQ